MNLILKISLTLKLIINKYFIFTYKLKNNVKRLLTFFLNVLMVYIKFFDYPMDYFAFYKSIYCRKPKYN